ncbi:MAG TPA: hypothetical protein VIF62_04405 [Labilithrix sp.]|jgi:hypothetical protein
MTSSRSVFVSILFAALGCVAIAFVQPDLARSIRKLHQRDDAFYLPPPNNLKVMSLGYHAAATDFLWALLILENGQHWVEHRKFTTVDKYVDEVIEMEPDYKNIYLYVDTLVLYVYGGADESQARAVRAYLERGMAERRDDPENWLHAGQSIAFFLPSFLKDEKEIGRYRADGARMILHAVELGASADRSLAATTVLMNQGEKDAIARESQIYALTDDPEARRQILGKLQRYKGDFGPTLAIDAIEREWREHWPILTRGAALLVGPPRPTAACAGPQSFGEPECPRDWNDYVAGIR